MGTGALRLGPLAQPPMEQHYLDPLGIASRDGLIAAISLNAASAGDNTIATIPAGRRFIVTHLLMESSGATDIIFKSGSTSLTGAFAWPTTGLPELGDRRSVLLRAAALGDNFIINSSAAVNLNGWVQYMEFPQ